MSNKRSLIFKKARRKFLQLAFGFEKWHISPLEERQYALDVITCCNNHLKRNFFIEIGCGLGDITRAVDYEKRIGFDMDPRVLKAAKWLSKNDETPPEFLYFKFPDSRPPANIDALVMVNWIHHIEPDILKVNITAYFNEHLSPTGMIVIDTVQDAAYKYKHDIAFLTSGITCVTVKVGSYERRRDIWSIKKTS